MTLVARSSKTPAGLSSSINRKIRVISMAREALTFQGWAECNLYAATAKNRKPATASLSGGTLTGSLTLSDSANKLQIGQLNRCRFVTGTNLMSSDRNHCISMPQVGQVGVSSSSSECFSLSITTLPQVQ